MNGYEKCPDCGLDIPVDAKVCPYCGKKFEVGFLKKQMI